MSDVEVMDVSSAISCSYDDAIFLVHPSYLPLSNVSF
jgi:hypothetical protein